VTGFQLGADDAERARRFEVDLRGLFPLWREAVGLGQGRVPTLIAHRTAVGAAKHLLGKPDLPAGFVRLCDGGRLELTIEYLVLRPEYGSLFTAEDRRIARLRLTESGMPRSALPSEPYD